MRCIILSLLWCNFRLGEQCILFVAETTARLKKTGPAEYEFYQAVDEVLTSLRPLLDKYRKYKKIASSSVL